MNDRLLILMFISVLFIGAAGFVIFPKESFSDMENRVLKSSPKFSWDRLMSKQFMNDMEAYIADHFPFRNHWVGIKSVSEQLRGQRENHGIYIGKDGYLFKRFEKPNDEEIEKYLDAIHRFA